MQWRVEPRFEYDGTQPAISRAGDALLLSHGDRVLALQTWDAGDVTVASAGAEGTFTIAAGDKALIVLAGFDETPLLLPDREAVERRIDVALDYWRRWSDGAEYDGRWRGAVVRSILALELLVHEPDGSMIAAPTSSLPERVGGDRNYDYRYAWVRDTTFAMDALLRLGYPDAVHAMLGWLLHTARRTHPRVHTFYGLDGRVHDSSIEIGFAGWRGSKPVRVGNDAGAQLQLGNFGDLMHTTWLFVEDGNTLDEESGHQLAESADLLCELWRNDDSSIWELEDVRPYTQGKMSSWLAFRRAKIGTSTNTRAISAKNGAICRLDLRVEHPSKNRMQAMPVSISSGARLERRWVIYFVLWPLAIGKVGRLRRFGSFVLRERRGI